MSLLLLLKLKGLNLLLFAKLSAGALSAYWALFGVAGVVTGWWTHAFWAIPTGILGSAMFIRYIWLNTREHDGFEKAFGADWGKRITHPQIKGMIRKRWSWFYGMNPTPKALWIKDMVYWTLPESGRELLCDIWQPADNYRSGLTLIYCHGSAWAMGDKDFFTRPFFRHLVGQGHCIMDIAYRLCPEVDIYEMVGDVKRAVVWMKTHASDYGVDPGKIILSGGSAGGHLALLSAYAPKHPDLTPGELLDTNLSVGGVLAYYPPTDLKMGFSAWRNANPMANLDPLPIGTLVEPKEQMRYAGRLDMLLGGSPEELPEIYDLVSPTTHVHPACPPTLLLQGGNDVLVPWKTTLTLAQKLREAGVPVVSSFFPMTEHIFDLVLPQFSPPAQSALYDVDRFLALMATRT